MFVQVIQGQVADREGLRRLGERWAAELRPGAEGFLGSTSGITDDGWLVNAVRFESESAARRNSDRPEQGRWWAEAVRCFSGEPTFVDSTDIEVLLDGGSDDARFVQAIIGTVNDRAGLQIAEKELLDRLRDLRPELIGGLRVWSGNHAIELAYFTSEEEARKGEALELPADLQDAFDRYQAAFDTIEYRDLRDLVYL